MSNMSGLKAQNALSQKLLMRLAELNIHALGGFHESMKYCLAVKVCNPTEAGTLGMDLGSGWGDIDFDRLADGRQFVVFRDALMQA
ncbi:hypothetical protein [Geoalkalibacter halelectricus]|uniref:hypothetical protein n=1 Tax=Geoalkalibacter halelectricus TaxID=2847045 RepID=UPI003D1A54C7